MPNLVIGLGTCLDLVGDLVGFTHLSLMLRLRTLFGSPCHLNHADQLTPSADTYRSHGKSTT